MWGGTLADRGGLGAASRKAIELGITTKEELGEMSEAWEKWIRADDGWFASMHGELLVKL